MDDGVALIGQPIDRDRETRIVVIDRADEDMGINSSLTVPSAAALAGHPPAGGVEVTGNVNSQAPEAAFLLEGGECGQVQATSGAMRHQIDEGAPIARHANGLACLDSLGKSLLHLCQ